MYLATANSGPRKVSLPPQEERLIKGAALLQDLMSHQPLCRNFRGVQPESPESRFGCSKIAGTTN